MLGTDLGLVRHAESLLGYDATPQARGSALDCRLATAVDGACMITGITSSMREPEIPVINRVPRGKVI